MPRCTAAAVLLAVCLLASTAAAAADPPVPVLGRPSFPAPVSSNGVPAGRLRLTIAATRANGITDVQRWIDRNRIDLREYRVPGSLDDLRLPALPAVVARTFRGARLARAIRQQRTLLLVYGEDYASGHLLVAADPRTGRTRYALDFQRYAYATRSNSGVFQAVVWAVESGGTLYVETSHSTYASSSGKRNAYITAIDLASKRVRWRSPALVANASRFEVSGQTIVSGYGFAREPDFVYLLDRRTGKPVAARSVPTGPEYIVRRGNTIYVRAYSEDLVLRLTRS